MPDSKSGVFGEDAQPEAVKALGHSALSDSFLAFTNHVKTLQVDCVADGLRLSLSYGGAKYNNAMHKVALALGALLPCRPLEDALLKLELPYGRDVLSGEYSKLGKLLAHGKSLQQVQSKLCSPGTTVAWMLEMLVLAFRAKLRAPSKAAEAWLDKDRKTGLAGFWFCLYVVAQAVRLIYGNQLMWSTVTVLVPLNLLMAGRCWNMLTSSSKASWPRT